MFFRALLRAAAAACLCLGQTATDEIISLTDGVPAVLLMSRSIRQ